MLARAFLDRVPLGVCVVRQDRAAMEVLYANTAGKVLSKAWTEGSCTEIERLLRAPTRPADSTLCLEGRWLTLAISEDVFEGAAAFVLWATDTSASHETQARLEKAVADADAAAEVKANFLATMSHEMRTPMQSVFGLLELIGEEKPDPKIASMVDIAKKSASGLLEILDDILDLAKIDAARMELDLFEVPVRTLVRGTLEALSVKTFGSKVTLSDDIAQEVPFVVIGDPKRLRQILMNLAGNAIKFTREGTVTVRVRARPRHPAGHILRFEIVDTGIGMSEAVRSRLFQPFTQADSSTSRKFGGTGLGLSICRKLVELMGGTIGVDSVEGQGSTFWFEIPTAEVDANASTVDLPSLEGLSVLSVEDHPQGAQEIVRTLRSMGASVESCPTVREGLDLAERRPFDVAVIDQGLPDGLGIDLIRKIMEIRPHMGLVMYTVRDDIGLQHTLQALGVTYLTKPASRLGLGEAVRGSACKIASLRTDGPSRLLIAEDTESVRDILRRQLEKLGVEADFATDGREALEGIRSGRYGILFTDLHMPEMDGYTLTETLRKEEAEANAMAGEKGVRTHFPIIVLTADVQMSQRQVYLRHGFDERLLKPVSLGHLQRLLTRWGLLHAPEKGAPEPADSETDPQPLPAVADATQTLPPAIDRQAMIEQMGAFDADAIEMLRMFVDMTAPLVDKIAQALAHSDYHALKESAHSLKGAARSACCPVLGDLAARLQDDATDLKPCADLVAQIGPEFERVCAEVGRLSVPDAGN